MFAVAVDASSDASIFWWIPILLIFYAFYVLIGVFR